MIEVGVKELKDGLSRYLRRVARGEHVRVTVRGRPLADIVPAGKVALDDPLRRLAAEGRLTLPARPKPTRAPALHDAASPASAHVLAERELER